MDSYNAPEPCTTENNLLNMVTMKAIPLHDMKACDGIRCR